MIIQGSHAPCSIPYHTFFPNRMLIGKLMYPLRLSKTYPQKSLSPPRFPFLGTETFLTVKECFFLPLRLSCKESSTFLTKPLSCPKREVVTALRCSEPLRYRVGGPIKGLAMLCGMGPPGDGKKYKFFYYSDRYLTIQGFNSGMSTSIVSHRLSGSMV